MSEKKEKESGKKFFWAVVQRSIFIMMVWMLVLRWANYEVSKIPLTDADIEAKARYEKQLRARDASADAAPPNDNFNFEPLTP